MTRTALTTAPANPLFSVHTQLRTYHSVLIQKSLCVSYSADCIEALCIEGVYSLKISVFLYTNAQLFWEKIGKIRSEKNYYFFYYVWYSILFVYLAIIFLFHVFILAENPVHCRHGDSKKIAVRYIVI